MASQSLESFGLLNKFVFPNEEQFRAMQVLDNACIEVPMKLCQVVYQLNEDGVLALLQLKWSNGVRSPFFAIENGNFVELSA